MSARKIQVYKEITQDLASGANQVYHQLGAQVTNVVFYLDSGDVAYMPYALTTNLEKSQFEVNSPGIYNDVKIGITALYNTENEVSCRGNC